MIYKNLLKTVGISILVTSGLFAKLNLMSWQKRLVRPDSTVCLELVEKADRYADEMGSGNLEIGDATQAHLEAIQETRKLISEILRKIHKEQRTIKDCNPKDQKAKRESLKNWLILAKNQRTKLTESHAKLNEALGSLDDSVEALALALLPRHSAPPPLTTKLAHLGLPRPKAHKRYNR